MRRNTGSIAANPVLIGAATVLVVVVAVFLAYNANNGLPFVPTYDVQAEVPNASGLIRGNEVRRGGARIGIISRIEPLRRDDGTAGALLTLKLDRKAGDLPVDSTLRIRPRSPLGLKYVEVTEGRSRETFAHGDRIPLERSAAKPVEIDEVFGMFDEATRKGQQGNLEGWGTALAGRGGELNETLRGIGPLTDKLEPAARALADPETEFDELFPAFEQAATEVEPVAREQGEMFGGLSATFAGLSAVSESIKATIAEGPRALGTATRELPAQASFVRESTELFRRLRPGTRALGDASEHLAPAFRAGEPAIRRAPALNRRLQGTFDALERFAADARVRPALGRLTATASLLQPTIAFATPAQTTCNYLALFFRNLGSALSESDKVGSFLRFGIVALPQLPGSEAGPAAVPANGPRGADVSRIDDSFLHSNPLPNTAAPGQERECEAGNEQYTPGRQVIGNQPGNQGTWSEPTGRWKAEGR
jgi:virulence factor Mce-like protein